MNNSTTFTHGEIVLAISLTAIFIIAVVAIYEKLLDRAEADLKDAETRAYWSEHYATDALQRLQAASIDHAAQRHYRTPAWAERDRDALLNSTLDEQRPNLYSVND